MVSFILDCLAIDALAQQHAEKAARLLGTAHEMNNWIMGQLSSAEWGIFEKNMNAVRSAVGEEQFARAFAEGQALEPERTAAEELEVGRIP